MTELIDAKIKTLPETPGVYIMRDQSGTVIYVGKAKNLKSRVRQYFQAIDRHAPKVRAMVEKVADFDVVIVDTELEALTLECNLIKQYQPHYNILLKDDKHYPYVRIDLSQPYPRVEVVRRVQHDSAKYFGPYRSAHALRQVLEACRKLFPLRTCKRTITLTSKPTRPCLNYHMGRCLGPCMGHVDPKEYRHIVDQVIHFLSGRHEFVLAALNQSMKEAAEKWDFERAASLRDRIADVEKIAERQKAISTGQENRDIIALAMSGALCCVQVMFMRGGKIIASESHRIQSEGAEEAEVLSSFLKQFYLNEPVTATEVLLPLALEEAEVLEGWLGKMLGRRVHVLCPQRGDKRRLVTMAGVNAQATLNKWLGESRARDREERGLLQLATALGLPRPPKRIEGFDISHIQGTNAVASMVVLVDGRPANKEYRRFRIKTAKGGDDFGSMNEVVYRRFMHAKKDAGGEGDGHFATLPDLLLIDGGKGQLGAAREAMEAAGFGHIPAFGLAKRLEEIYQVGEKLPLQLPMNSDALKLIQRLRDEAHRFAITYHRSLRGKSGLLSQLDEVKGIGSKRRRALLMHFRTLEALRAATVEEIGAVQGMSRPAAQAVYDHLRRMQEADTPAEETATAGMAQAANTDQKAGMPAQQRQKDL